MDRKRIRKEMVRLISEIRKYESLLDDTGKTLTKADLGQLLRDVNALQEKSIVLAYLQDAVEKGEVNEVSEVKQIKEPELIRRSEIKKTDAPAPIKLEEMPEVTGNINQEQVRMPGDDKLETQHTVKTEEKKPEVKAEEKTVKTDEPAKSSKQPEMDLFSGEIPVVAKPEPKPKEKEKQKPVEDKSLAQKLKKKPIPDLKAAIGINEKFQYINELFEGNMTEYNIAINQLNICNSYTEAQVYLNTLRELYKWDGESETVSSFAELVERRFL